MSSPVLAAKRTFAINDPVKNGVQAFLHNSISTSKYNYFTFIPKFFKEQFSKYANIFFLFTACIQQIPNVSPTSRYTTIIPLSLVLLASAIKEIMEDFKRHRSDDEVNNRITHRLSGDHFEDIKWNEVGVGDLLRIQNGEFFPADLILLSSSEPDALCYIETANLDGETNLKIRQGRPETANILSSHQAREMHGHIETELPNNSLYTFEGTMDLTSIGKQFPLDPAQLLLRGALLKNTRWVYGIVVFTGHESKLMRNATAAPIKRTSVEKMTNKQIVLLFFILLTLAVCSAIGSLSTTLNYASSFSYIFPFGIPIGDVWRDFGLNILTFIILFNNLIPISLVVTMEVVKLQQSLLINCDLDMYYERFDTPAVCRTSSLVEELGQIEYIFSDKTGTLTCNEMEFRKCSIAGVSYSDSTPEGARATALDGMVSFDYSQLQAHLRVDKSASATAREQLQAKTITDFFTLLAVCHTVIPELKDEGVDAEDTESSASSVAVKRSGPPKPSDINYQASSPDENALVIGARQQGFFFHTRRPKSITITARGREEDYEILQVCEFNSTRKRMSTIVRCPDGKVRVFIKGADTVILERLRKTGEGSSDPNPFLQRTLTHLEEYASEGLRTLCLAMREVPENEYQEWSKVYEKAAITINNRQEELDKAAEMIEKNLTLVGATAIEDKLQDGVPDAIRTLSETGIKIWVLTGDRQETAINIGYSCQLFTEDMTIIIINESNKQATKEALLKKLRKVKEVASRHSVQLDRKRFDPDAKKPSWRESILQSFYSLLGIAVYRKLEDKSRAPSPTAENSNALSLATNNDPFDSLDPSQLSGLALVIDGKSLGFALDPELELIFLELATICKAVMCCRVSPLQKALVVRMVKNKMKRLTLAIGDGANDVGMIQAANVGVGISGNEGLQAARSSDFAISQFRFLKKLLMVHGTWSYQRLSQLILYSFYKNITLYMTQFWFAFYNGFSGQTVYESWTISLYNVLFTLMPPFAIGVFEQFVVARMLERYPKIYQLAQNSEFLNVGTFWGWAINAIYHSIVLFFLVYFSLGTENMTIGNPYAGDTAGQWYMGTLLYTAVLATVLLKAALISVHWTKYTVLSIPGSFVLWIIFLPIYAKYSYELQNVPTPLLGSGVFWFTIIIVPIICISRDFVWKYWKRQNRPRSYHIVQEIHKYNIPDYRPHAERFKKAVVRVRMMQRLRQSRGFAFSQNESGQANLIRKYDTTQRKPSGK